MSFATEEGEILAAGSILQLLDIGIIAANTSVTSSLSHLKLRSKQQERKRRRKRKRKLTSSTQTDPTPSAHS